MVTPRRTASPDRRHHGTPAQTDARHAEEMRSGNWTEAQIAAAHGLDPSRPEIQEAATRAREWLAEEQRKRDRPRALTE